MIKMLFFMFVIMAATIPCSTGREEVFCFEDRIIVENTDSQFDGMHGTVIDYYRPGYIVEIDGHERHRLFLTAYQMRKE